MYYHISFLLIQKLLYLFIHLFITDFPLFSLLGRLDSPFSFNLSLKRLHFLLTISTTFKVIIALFSSFLFSASFAFWAVYDGGTRGLIRLKSEVSKDIPNTREGYRLRSAKSVQVATFFSWTSVGDFLFKTKIWDQFDLVECFTHDVFVKLIEIGLILTWKEICLKPEWSATTSLYWKF